MYVTFPPIYEMETIILTFIFPFLLVLEYSLVVDHLITSIHEAPVPLYVNVHRMGSVLD